MNQGWTCPACGRGVAPTEKTCDHGWAAMVPSVFLPYYEPPMRTNPYDVVTLPHPLTSCGETGHIHESPT